MSVDIYPAKIGENGVVDHADNWSDHSTLNLANGNFYDFIYEIGLGHTAENGVPFDISVTDFRAAIEAHPFNRYTSYVIAICDKAVELNATIIACV